MKRFLRTRDEVSFRELYNLHTPGLYQTAMRLMKWMEFDAEEAVQETWIRAVRGFDDFRWKSSLHTWLTAILIRCCQGIWRSRPPVMNLDLEANEPRSISGTEDTIALEAAISTLPEGYRAVLILYDIEGYTHEEIAELLQIDPGTSKSQLHRARKSIRAYLNRKRGVSNERARTSR